jgi:hypothetical protein
MLESLKWRTESGNGQASRSDSLAASRTLRNADVKMLNLLAAFREINFQFEAIRTVEIPIGVIERDKCRRLHRQTLLQIGRLQRRALDRDGAMLGSNHQPDRRQWTRTAIGANARVNRNAHVASGRRFDLTLDRIVVLRIGLLFDLGPNVGRGHVKGTRRQQHGCKDSRRTFSRPMC